MGITADSRFRSSSLVGSSGASSCRPSHLYKVLRDIKEGFASVHAPVAGSVAQASPVTPRTVGEGKEQTSSKRGVKLRDSIRFAKDQIGPLRFTLHRPHCGRTKTLDAQFAAGGGSRAMTDCRAISVLEKVLRWSKATACFRHRIAVGWVYMVSSPLGWFLLIPILGGLPCFVYPITSQSVTPCPPYHSLPTPATKIFYI